MTIIIFLLFGKIGTISAILSFLFFLLQPPSFIRLCSDRLRISWFGVQESLAVPPHWRVNCWEQQLCPFNEILRRFTFFTLGYMQKRRASVPCDGSSSSGNDRKGSHWMFDQSIRISLEEAESWRKLRAGSTALLALFTGCNLLMIQRLTRSSFIVWQHRRPSFDTLRRPHDGNQHTTTTSLHSSLFLPLLRLLSFIDIGIQMTQRRDVFFFF